MARHSASVLDLLDVLEASVIAGGGAFGRRGRLCIGVADPRGPRWLNVDAGEGALEVTRGPEPLVGPDAVLLLGAVEAQRLLVGEALPAAPSRLVTVAGDVTLLDGFFGRYLGSRSWLGAQKKQAPARKDKRR